MCYKGSNSFSFSEIIIVIARVNQDENNRRIWPQKNCVVSRLK